MQMPLQKTLLNACRYSSQPCPGPTRHSKLITANTQAAAVCFIALTNLCGLLQFVGIYAGFASTQVLADLYSVAAGVA